MVDVVVDTAGTVTLVEGALYCLSRPSGDLVGGIDGLYVRDTRLLSRLGLRLNGEVPEPLHHVLDPPSGATFVSRARPAPGAIDSSVVVIRTRWVGHGLREDIVLRNLSAEPAYCELEVLVAADLVDADQVRAGRAEAADDIEVSVAGHGVIISRGRGAERLGCHATGTGAPKVHAGGLRYETIIPARGDWTVTLSVAPIVGGEELEPRHPVGDPVERSEPSERLDRWRRAVPAIETDHRGLANAITRGAEDLGSLRVFDPEFPERAVVAAGVPWYLSLFGRDALLTAWMALVVDPDLALGVLETLARFQGAEVDGRTEEEPGRILQRMRFGPGAFVAGPDSVSYGSADATPLFVMLLGELRRWGLAPELVDRLLPHADRALAWIDDFGDRDGDGYVEYMRASDRGVPHQSWKDSAGAICSLDGRTALAPIAPAEVQGYVYSAFLARAHFAQEAGDTAVAERYRAKAAALKTAFNRDFWVEEHGWLAMALDADKRVVDGLASNMGHCLWTGILDEDHAAVVAKHLLSPDLFSGWGIRTLAVGARAYNPAGIHTGAVWPHDSAICAAGLMRYGFVDEAHRIILGQLDAASAHGGRLPPVLCGFDRDDLDAPVPYPEACTTRAWSAAAPLMFLRVLLRIDPWIPYGKLWLDPALPAGIQRLRVERIPLLGGRVTVDVDGDNVSVEDLPKAIELIRHPRAPLTAAVP